MTSQSARVQGDSKGGGTPPFGQHGLAAAKPSAGRRHYPKDRSSQNETNQGGECLPSESTTDVSEMSRGGDRRVACRQARNKRVTVRMTDKEYAQLTRAANRYGLDKAAAIRAGVDMLDGAPPPKVVDANALRLIAEVNAVGVNINQLARQGWQGIAPEIDELRAAAVKLDELARELA